MLPIKSYNPEKICPIFEKGEKHPPPPAKRQVILITNNTIRFSISKNPIVEVSSSYIQKKWNFAVFARSKITDARLFDLNDLFFF